MDADDSASRIFEFYSPVFHQSSYSPLSGAIHRHKFISFESYGCTDKDQVSIIFFDEIGKLGKEVALPCDIHLEHFLCVVVVDGVKFFYIADTCTTDNTRKIWILFFDLLCGLGDAFFARQVGS
jgi:hypothetical protein